MKMKQVDIHTSRLGSLGGFLHTVKNSMAIFGILMFFIGLYGWHQLVFVKIIPNFWTFMGLFVAAFIILCAAQYFVLTPLEVAYINRQTYTHDPRNGGP
jgi:hypothetical protein